MTINDKDTNREVESTDKVIITETTTKTEETIGTKETTIIEDKTTKKELTTSTMNIVTTHNPFSVEELNVTTEEGHLFTEEQEEKTTKITPNTTLTKDMDFLTTEEIINTTGI